MHLCERHLARVGNHRERRDCLLLHEPTSVAAAIGRMKELQEAFDDRIEVRHEGVVFNSFTKVNEGRCGVRVNSGPYDRIRRESHQPRITRTSAQERQALE